MRTMLVLASLAMLTVLGASGWAAAPVQHYVFIGEDQDGTLIVRAFAPSDHFTICGGTAPLITSCTSGPHTPAAGPTSYVHGFIFPAGSPLFLAPDYTGAASSTVSDGVNTRTFTCGVIAGQIPPVSQPGVLGCSGTGTKPSGTFNQTCHSYFLATPTLPTGGVEGGLGDWQCYVDGANGYPAP
jgi:hypothetical protein